MQAQTVALAWVVSLRSRDAARATDVTITAPTGTGTAQTVIAATVDALPFIYIEPRASQSSAETEVTIRLAVGAVAACDVMSISCFAISRGQLAQSSTDHGIDDYSVSPRQPIFDGGSGTGRSLGEALRVTQTAITTARRVGLFQLGLPDNSGDAIQLVSAVYLALYTGGVQCLARKLYTSSTTGTVSCKALAWASSTAGGGTYATMRVNTTSGGTGVTTLALGTSGARLTTTPTWYPNNAATFSVACEDLTTSDGLRGAAWDEVTFDALVNAGPATVYIATISGWEA